MFLKTSKFVICLFFTILIGVSTTFASSSADANLHKSHKTTKKVAKSFEENIDDSYDAKFESTNISHIINSSSSQQVMLRVKIGEVNKQVGTSFFTLAEKDMLRIFAEPTLVALSGTSAFFQSGGEFPIVSPSGIEFKSYGLKISFTPVVISSSRIKMEIYSEISELSKNVFIYSNSSKIPVIESRKAKTTVELAPGESFMIAGLVKDIVNSSLRDNTELVVSVTPYIVHPVSAGSIRLPTDKYYKQNNMEIKFIENLNKNSGITPSSTNKLEGPAGLIAE
jgi:Flp pilus assembly secretin CpaC